MTATSQFNITGQIRYAIGFGPTVLTGSNAKSGTVTLSGGAGTVTNTSVTAASMIFFGLQTASGTIAATPWAATITAGTGFTVAGTATDNSTWYYFIVESA